MRKKPSKKNENFWADGLKLMKQCPVCTAEYSENSLKILEDAPETKLVHLTCPECHHAVIAMILVTRLGVSSIGLLTDLTAVEGKRFQTRRLLNENDVLEFHNFLGKHTHKLSYLFCS